MAFTNTGPGRQAGDIATTKDATYAKNGYVVTGVGNGPNPYVSRSVGYIDRNPGGGQALPGGTVAPSGSGAYRSFPNKVGGIVRPGRG